jgi:cell wall-associated NlpC family hydrolase
MLLVACIVAVAPLRKEATHRSEMVSEILLGEFAEVIESSKDFLRIKCLFDGYEGWCQRVQLTEVSQIMETNTFLSKGISTAKINGRDCRISCGTPVYATEQLIRLGQFDIQYPSKYSADATKMEWNAANIEFIAHQFINTPYLWGGKSTFGIDCSGFTQQVFKLFDIKLLRDAYQQAETGETIGFLQLAVCGDLAFFDNEEGRITHVGILLNTDTIIHASGRVRIDKIDNAGIISSDTGERTHNLRIIKRLQ